MRAWVTGGSSTEAAVIEDGVADGAAVDAVTVVESPGAAAPWLAAIDVTELTLVQRLLLTTDGTITHILEAHSGERAEIVKLHEVIEPGDRGDSDLHPCDGETLLRRRVLIRGAVTGAPFIYAVSSVALDRLSSAVRHALVHTDEPIGRLMFAHRVESLREILAVWREPAGECAPYFGVDADTPALCRNYRILCGGRPVMLITEKFPATSFE